MSRLVCGDWGTSSLRLRLIDTDSLVVLEEVVSDEGVAATFSAWTASGGDREAFFFSFLRPFLAGFGAADVVLSGMASSNIGLIELPYAPLPFRVDGADLVSAWVADHRCLVVSGVRSAVDVMRGEETALVGCSPSSGLYIFPGTHSKHVTVVDGYAVDFRTFMTGEFFALLSQHSLLGRSVLRSDTFDAGAFSQGVLDGHASPLLNAAFHVRTNQLFDRLTPAQNYHYLSGVVIGSELNGVVGTPVIVGDARQRLLYQAAASALGLTVVVVDAVDATLRGQVALFRRLA